MENNTTKTGTTTVALVCQDGLVLAADKRVTQGNFIASKKAEKVFPIYDFMAVTVAGGVSDIQLVVKLIKAELKLKEVRTNKKPGAKEAANLLSGIIYSNIRKMSVIPGITQFLLGGKENGNFKLFDLGVDGSILEIDDFIASGSGQEFALGVFETLYQPDMTVEQGTELALKAVNAGMQRDSASGDGIDVVTITQAGVKKIKSKKPQSKE